MAYEYITTRLVDCQDADPGPVAAIIKGMEDEARQALRAEGLSDREIVLQRLFDMRFVHQRHEVPVVMPDGPVTRRTIEEGEHGFRQVYAEMFKVKPDDPCQIVNFRVRAVGLVPKPGVAKTARGDGSSNRALKGRRKAYFQEVGGFVETDVYDRLRLLHGDRIDGAAIIEEPDSTTICPPGYTIEVDQFLNLLIAKAG
jgi:N-methylhydantoinase A